MAAHPSRGLVFMVTLLILTGMTHLDAAADHFFNKTATEGEFVTLSCNGSLTNMTEQVTWKKDNIAIYTYARNKSLSNYTSPRMNVDSVTRLSISDVKPDDSGNYSCNVVGKRGDQTIKWTLKIHPKEDPGLTWLLFILLPSCIGGMVLMVSLSCCIWLCR